MISRRGNGPDAENPEEFMVQHYNEAHLESAKKALKKLESVCKRMERYREKNKDRDDRMNQRAARDFRPIQGTFSNHPHGGRGPCRQK